MVIDPIDKITLQYEKYCKAIDAYVQAILAGVKRPEIDKLRTAFHEALDEFLNEETTDEQPVSN